MLHNIMPPTRQAVKAMLSYTKERTEAHVHVNAVSGFMREKSKDSAYFVKVPYKAPPT